MRGKERVKIRAALLKEVLKFLEEKGLREKLERGELRCAVCGEVLSEKNIGAVRVAKGRVVLICNKVECLTKASAEALEQNTLWVS